MRIHIKDNQPWLCDGKLRPLRLTKANKDLWEANLNGYGFYKISRYNEPAVYISYGENEFKVTTANGTPVEGLVEIQPERMVISMYDNYF